MIKPDLNIMRAAIEAAEKNLTPFGAALAMGDEIFITASDQTRQLDDPTAHAEIVAIRKLGEQLKKKDLSGFTLYSTCEPCPMCMSAAIWAKINTVFFGCNMPEISKHMDQINIRAADITRQSNHKIDVIGGVLETECFHLLNQFA